MKALKIDQEKCKTISHRMAIDYFPYLQWYIRNSSPFCSFWIKLIETYESYMKENPCIPSLRYKPATGKHLALWKLPFYLNHNTSHEFSDLVAWLDSPNIFYTNRGKPHTDRQKSQVHSWRHIRNVKWWTLCQLIFQTTCSESICF